MFKITIDNSVYKQLGGGQDSEINIFNAPILSSEDSDLNENTAEATFSITSFLLIFVPFGIKFCVTNEL